MQLHMAPQLAEIYARLSVPTDDREPTHEDQLHKHSTLSTKTMLDKELLSGL